MTAALAEPTNTTRIGTNSRQPRANREASRARFTIRAGRQDAAAAVRPMRQSSELLPQLIADHQTEVWRYLRVLGCSADLADDLTQETFLNAFHRPFNYRGKAAAASYLRRSAYHRYLNYLRANQQTHELCEVQAADITWTRWQNSQRNSEDTLEILKDCLAKLQQRERLALELRFRENRSRQEIAEALSMSEHGAKNLMQRAKKKLHRLIEVRLGQVN